MNLSLKEPLARRLRLATMPAPQGARGPSLRLWLGEGLRILPKRKPPELAVPKAAVRRHVMLLPGFAAHPRAMRHLEAALQQAGHKVYDWGAGRNLGADPVQFERQVDNLERICAKARQPVVLIGWSLGGIMARELAHRRPQAVSGVITMGTPFSGSPHANNAWRTYHLVTGHAVDAPPMDVHYADKPPVPTVALWSPRDGIVAPRCARGLADQRDRAIALRCTHFGFAGDPEVVTTLLDLLDGGQDWA
ncbi:serine aminopeptidase S33 family [Novosphingobium kunmingense]|uniref:Serine aminopeptidase S33 family n=1 Tax=Novosphingobium kunmingense TaxID=1211806 RepID=A0A2N0H676_9SPHN|nr:alpha/beta fold hydrolase [Novosphingobium kunmingense]PKB14420.1 serine aminopeptidase S33 family [Novosphingobium kunmingense]